MQNYEHMGKGFCVHGYYKGWTDDADSNIMDYEKCAAHCDEEPECLYFSLKPMQTCSRYNSDAGECETGGQDDHELYKKIGTYTMHQFHYVS